MINLSVIFKISSGVATIVGAVITVLGVFLIFFLTFYLKDKKHFEESKKQHDEKLKLEKQKQFDDKQYRRLKFVKDFSKLNEKEKEFIKLYEKKYLETDITLRVSIKPKNNQKIKQSFWLIFQNKKKHCLK